MTDDFRQAAAHTIAFLRMAASDLRRIAGRAPELADELRRMADQLDADGEALARQVPDLPHDRT